jgi:transposase InsO family protein
MTQKDFSKTWGTSHKSLFNWVKIYQERGPKALENDLFRPDGKKRGRKGLPEPVKGEITAVKRENPEFGTKKVRDFLFRFRGVKVANGTVRKTLKEANIPPLERVKKKRRKKPAVQRFERALPMQLWQTDITTLSLARHSQKVYLTVFMDDYSRYVVSWALQLQQTKEFVMETLLSGIQRFGKPEEVLTDQGRQYFSWRGKSDFRKLLIKQGIRHVVSRAHHPETVGKCERFWETVKAEFWERVEPQDLEDARERLGRFIEHYNHMRPHQGIDGMTPADRFFGAAADVRKAIEDTISKNALRLAIGEAPRQPVFLIGQIGDQAISLHGEKGKLLLQTTDGATKRLDYEDFGHTSKQESAPLATQNQGEKTHDDDKNRSEFARIAAEGTEDASSAHEKQGASDAEAAGLPRSGALGDGLGGAEEAGARDVDPDHGVLAGTDHQAGAGGKTQGTADLPPKNRAI